MACWRSLKQSGSGLSRYLSCIATEATARRLQRKHARRQQSATGVEVSENPSFQRITSLIVLSNSSAVAGLTIQPDAPAALASRLLDCCYSVVRKEIGTNL